MNLDKSVIRRALYCLCVAATLGLFYLFYLDRLTSLEDLNGEAIDTPITVFLLEKARASGLPFGDFIANDPLVKNLLAEDHRLMHSYPAGVMKFEYFASQGPLTVFLYLPFIMLFGLTNKAVALFSLFYFALTILVLWRLVHKSYGAWYAFPALWLIMGNLIWLIHVKSVYVVWMPSALLLSVLGLSLYMYMENRHMRWLIVCGISIGMLYLVAWITIAFGVLICTILLLWHDIQVGIRKVLKSLLLVYSTSLAAAGGITALYCSFYSLPVAEMTGGLLKGILHRFFQGGVPVVKLSLSGRLGYAFKCMFVDSRTFDHLDKCLEGKPMIDIWLLPVIIIGLFYAFQRRTRADIIFLAWLFVVYAFLGSLFDYCHRYAIMGLPALTVICARGIGALTEDLSRLVSPKAGYLCVVIFAAGTLTGLHNAYSNYYDDYTFRKRPDFEVDRARGLNFVSSWITQNFNPSNTVVVMGDSIMLSNNSFVFYTSGRHYPFIYFYNTCYNGQNIRDRDTCRIWQDGLLKKYENILYVLPLVNFYGTNPIYWQPILDANPGLKPSLFYSYSGRPPSIALLHIKQTALR